MKPNPTWDTWAKWLGREPNPGTIYKDVVDMLAARQIWEGFNEIVGVAPEKARKYSTFHTWFNSSYLRAQGLAIRRQVEARKDVVSLGRLLAGIARQPYVLSRERYLAELHGDDRRIGDEDFDTLTAPGTKTIDPAVPTADLERLRTKTAAIKTWVDKEVAHYDPATGRFSEGLTFGDIHQAIDLIFRTMNRYQKLILGTTIVCSVAMDPWQAVFRHAWIPDDEAWLAVMAKVQEKDRERLNQLGELPS